MSRNVGTSNPNYKHGLRNTRLFSIWSNIKSRCNNPNSTYYSRYGGRGITICEEWRTDFKVFYNWSISNGYSDELTIDRIDNNGNYESSNCRWITPKKQSNNNSRNIIVNINNTERTLMEWCEHYNINYKTVRDRIKRGWDVKKALEEPVQIKFRKKVM